MNAIKELRIEKNLSQTQLAQAIGTSQKNITRWETGKTEPNTYFICELAKFFSVSADFLLGLEDDFGQKEYEKPNFALTPDERKIVNAYRGLTPSNQEMILRMLNIK